MFDTNTTPLSSPLILIVSFFPFISPPNLDYLTDNNNIINCDNYSINLEESIITTSSDVWGDKFCWTSDQEVYRNDVVVSGSNADHTLVTPRPEIESVFLTHSLRGYTALITEFIPSFRHERSHKVEERADRKSAPRFPCAFTLVDETAKWLVPSLGRFGSNLLLQQLILKLDHGWSRLGMFIVEVLLVYILHGYCHWRLFSCVLLGGAAHPLQCIKCRNYHLYCSCHQSLFKCDLVEGSRELFIADDITRLHGYHRQSRLSCSFVGVRRLVYMALMFHSSCFRAVAVLTQLKFEHGETPFQLNFRDDDDEVGSWYRMYNFH